MRRCEEVPLSTIKLDKSARESLSRLLARHLKDELDVEIEQFDALDLLDRVCEWLGPYAYNQALYDAQAIIRARVDTIVEAVEAIEKPLTLR